METIFEPDSPVSFLEKRKRDFERLYPEEERAKIAACPRHCHHMPPDDPTQGVRLAHTANGNGEYSMFAPPCDETTCPMGRNEAIAREKKMRQWKVTAWMYEHVLSAACASVEDVRQQWLEHAASETEEFRDEIREFVNRITDDDVRRFQFSR